MTAKISFGALLSHKYERHGLCVGRNKYIALGAAQQRHRVIECYTRH
jgi:hypothetical protein